MTLRNLIDVISRHSSASRMQYDASSSIACTFRTCSASKARTYVEDGSSFPLFRIRFHICVCILYCDRYYLLLWLFCVCAIVLLFDRQNSFAKLLLRKRPNQFIDRHWMVLVSWVLIFSLFYLVLNYFY